MIRLAQAPPLADDAELADAFRSGDESALRQAYERWSGLVHAFCLRSLPSAADAEEASAQVFVSAWRGRHTLDPRRGSLSGWLLGIARHEVGDRHRRAARERELRASLAAALPQPAPSPDELVDRLLVADELARLPDVQRRAIELACLAGHTHQEVAQLLGLPLGTVKSHIRRGLLRLRDRMEEEGWSTSTQTASPSAPSVSGPAAATISIWRSAQTAATS
jgi:RNA polymerase sigma factor (sigma-70 family)